MHCEEHGSGLFLQVSNPFLHLSILKMSIDTTISQALVVVFACMDKSIVCESAIVDMIVENLDSKVSVLSSIGHESREPMNTPVVIFTNCLILKV